MNDEKGPDEKRTIAKSVFKWYNEYRARNQEVEEVFLKEIEANTSDGRIELVLLARLFSQYVLREEKAIEIWNEFRRWFRKERFGYREI